MSGAGFPRQPQELYQEMEVEVNIAVAGEGEGEVDNSVEGSNLE